MGRLSLRLTQKILAIGVIGLAGVVLVGGIHLLGERAMEVYRIAAEDARTIAELNGKVEIELLEGRRAEKDFLLRNDQKSADKQIELSRRVAADIAALRKLVASIGKADLVRQIDSMQASLGQYQARFESVVGLKKKLGLDEDSGLEGRLRSSVHAIETKGRRAA